MSRNGRMWVPAFLNSLTHPSFVMRFRLVGSALFYRLTLPPLDPPPPEPLASEHPILRPLGPSICPLVADFSTDTRRNCDADRYMPALRNRYEGHLRLPANAWDV